jgi:hypothetical protein
MAKLRGKHYTTKDIISYSKIYYKQGKIDMKIEILEIINKYCGRTDMGVFKELLDEVYGMNPYIKRKKEHEK